MTENEHHDDRRIPLGWRATRRSFVGTLTALSVVAGASSGSAENAADGTETGYGVGGYGEGGYGHPTEGEEPADDPFFGVDIEDATTPIEAGEPIHVTVYVENEGEQEDEQEIVLDVDEIGQDLTVLSLEPGESASVTLALDTTVGDAGEYIATVSSEDEIDTETITVAEPSADSFFAVRIEETNDPIRREETLEIGVIVENTGGSDDEQLIELALDGNRIGGRTANLGPGQTEAITFAHEIDEGFDNRGRQSVRVESDDDSDTRRIQVVGRPGGIPPRGPPGGRD